MLLVLMGICLFVCSGVSLTLPAAGLDDLSQLHLLEAYFPPNIRSDKQCGLTVGQKTTSLMGDGFQASPSFTGSGTDIASPV